MYRDRTASPYDGDEDDVSHAEMFFYAFLEVGDDYVLLDEMIEDSRVLWTVLRLFQKLLEINDDTDRKRFSTILLEKDC
ncbi:hypothetical protein FVEN_g12864 [Fusarium venenatum]|nr:hypothetical protein FVEN_g12864 [Fusarium venenatum]